MSQYHVDGWVFFLYFLQALVKQDLPRSFRVFSFHSPYVCQHEDPLLDQSGVVDKLVRFDGEGANGHGVFERVSGLAF